MPRSPFLSTENKDPPPPPPWQFSGHHSGYRAALQVALFFLLFRGPTLSLEGVPCGVEAGARKLVWPSRRRWEEAWPGWSTRLPHSRSQH